MNIVITTTWNSQDLVETFLDHYQKLGFDRVMLMDFDSADGTMDIVCSAKYRGFLDLAPYPGLAGLDSSQLMLELAREKLPADARCLFCDPDELLVLPSGAQLSYLASSRADALVIPRFNVTGLQSDVLLDPGSVSATGSLNLRIDGRCARQPGEDINKDELDPPWIYTDMPGKVFVRLGRTASIAVGDHSASLLEGEAQAARSGAYFLHYPIRTYEQFAEKVRMYRTHFELNPQLPEGVGWQARRWVRVAQQCRLHDEYKQQFPTDSLADNMVRTGILVVDNSIRMLHSRN